MWKAANNPRMKTTGKLGSRMFHGFHWAHGPRSPRGSLPTHKLNFTPTLQPSIIQRQTLLSLLLFKMLTIMWYDNSCGNSARGKINLQLSVLSTLTLIGLSVQLNVLLGSHIYNLQTGWIINISQKMYLYVFASFNVKVTMAVSGLLCRWLPRNTGILRFQRKCLHSGVI